MIYFRILLFPVGLHMEWDIAPAKSFLQDEVFLSIICLSIIFIFMYYLSKTNKLKFFASGWFFIMLIPYLNIVPLNYFLVDGWLYIQSIGFFMLSVLYFYELRQRSRLWKNLADYFVIGVIIIFSVLTFKRSDVWADSVK